MRGPGCQTWLQGKQSGRGLSGWAWVGDATGVAGVIVVLLAALAKTELITSGRTINRSLLDT